MSDEGKMSKGLEALLGDVEKPNKNLVKNIKTEQIIPNRFQPRKSFNEESLNELADSIKRHGILSRSLLGKSLLTVMKLSLEKGGLGPQTKTTLRSAMHYRKF